jgi:hypothetical protein
MAALNSFMFKKHTTNQKRKGKGCAVKDFILDCVQEMTEPDKRKDGQDNAGNESLALTLTAQT